MKSGTAAVLGLMMLSGIVPPSHAEAPSRRGRPGRGYDPGTVETIKGEIVAVEHVAGGKGRRGGVHVTLKSDRETLPVHLGPAWYVDEQKVRLERGDHVEIEGSRIDFGGKPAIVARQVKKGAETLVLRNETGVPVWAGRGGGRGRGRETDQ